jgi:PKD repeat protein
VLPIIMMLTLTALDFGRIYLGYINIQNMARIAANFAANNPDAWTASLNPAVQATRDQSKIKYQNEIRSDASASNCSLPKVAGVATAPAPTFKKADGTVTTAPTIGDRADVGITCTFGVITPVISNVVGGSVQVSAASTFPVKTGMTVPAGGVVVGSAPNAAFMANTVQAPTALTGIKDFTVQFDDTSGGSPTAWAWDFNCDGNTDSTQRDPIYVFTIAPTSCLVKLTASNLYGSSSMTQQITVNNATIVDFTITPSGGNAPLPVTFADNGSTPGGLLYTWTFGLLQGVATGPTLTTTSHTYNTAGTYTVTLTITYLTGPVTVSKTVSVGSTLCTVPPLKNVKRFAAQATWNASGFTGLVTDGIGAPLLTDYNIKSQSEVGGDTKPCTIGVVVNDK